MALLQPVPAPLAGPPRFGLLVAANVLTDALRWEGGYTFVPEACGLGGTFDPCGTVAFDPDLGHPDAVENIPFGIWEGDRCSVMGADLADLRARARRALEANQSQHIAAEFWTGDQATAAGWADNQRLAAGGGVPVAGTAVVPARAVGLLEGALAGQQGNRRGMIHVTVETLSALAAESVIRREGNLWLTPADHIVVADAGYPGTGPTGQAAAEDAMWAFATGLVTVRMSEVAVMPDDDRQAVDARVNSALFVASRVASAAWDGCALAAVSIDLT